MVARGYLLKQECHKERDYRILKFILKTEN